VDTRFWLIQAFNGVSYGALLFLVGSGLSLIFGVMRIVNLAHGSYFLLGSYVALSVIWTTGSWLLAIPVAGVAVALLGLVMERIFLRPLGFDPLRQVLLTVGFALLFQQAALDIWGGDSLDIIPPAALRQRCRHRRSLSAALSGLHDRDRCHDRSDPVARHREDAYGSGGPAPRSMTQKWRVASGSTPRGYRCSSLPLARCWRDWGGVIGGAFLGVYPGLDFQILPVAFAVVIIGGMGSLGGAAIGALIVGLADNFGKALFPEVSYFTLYAPMVLLLAVKPTGLFGRE